MDWTKGPIEAHERHMTRPIIRLIEDDVRVQHTTIAPRVPHITSPKSPNTRLKSPRSSWRSDSLGIYESYPAYALICSVPRGEWIVELLAEWIGNEWGV